MNIKFEWDAAKARQNVLKHHVSFETAARIFADQFAVTRQDRIEDGEHRWQTLGYVDGYLLLLVAHTIRDDRDGTEIVRIISARRAEPREKKRYEQNRSL